MSDYETQPDPQGTPEESGLAGRGARLGAYLIDWILVGVVAGVIGYTAGLMERLMRQDTAAVLWFAAIALVVYGVINGRLLATRGQTVGKKLVGVRIVGAPTRQIVPVWKSFGLRIVVIQAITSAPLVGAIFGLLDVLFIFGERRRCLHDLLAGTIVVDAAAAPRD